jgi:hypothetical protein
VNQQEAFDTAVRGLASQGFRRSMAWAYLKDLHESPMLKCAYTSDDSKRHCAFGWLIVGISLSSEQNPMSANALCEANQKVRERVGDLGEIFLFDLQNTHDTAHVDTNGPPNPDEDAPAKMIANLREFAKRWELDPTVLNEVAPEGWVP